MSITTIKEGNYLKPEEIQKLFDVCENDTEIAILATLVYTGARISEIVGIGTPITNIENKYIGYTKNRNDAMTPASINFEREFISLRNLKNKRVKLRCSKCYHLLPRTAKQCFCGNQEIIEKFQPKRFKCVNVPKEYLSIINNYIESKNIDKNSPIFPFSRFEIYYMIRKIGKRAGIEKVGDKYLHCHTMRHSFVMRGVNSNVSLTFLQKQLGHKSIATISEYMSLREEDIIKAKKKMWG